MDPGRRADRNAKGVIARLKDAASDGMNADDYPVPDFAAATSPDGLAEADLKLTQSMLDYARQAQSGRMHWSQLSGDIQYPEHPTDPTEVLNNITTAKDASIALDGYNPPQKLYQELKAKLAELRGQGDAPVATIGDGPALRYTPAKGNKGKKQAEVVVEDPRVPQLRAKLGITENADDTHYDAKVADAVRKFQENAELQCHRRARRTDRQGDQQPEARPTDRHRGRQHGALALAAARPWRARDRRRLCHPQHPRLYPQGDAARRPGLDHQGGDRQAGHSRHAASDRNDEVHHGQSDLERAAVDRL